MKMNVISALSLVSVVLASTVSFAAQSTAKEQIVKLACLTPSSAQMETLCNEAGAIDQDKKRVEAMLVPMYSEMHLQNKTMKEYFARGSSMTEAVCGDLDAKHSYECSVTTTAGDSEGQFNLTTKVTALIGADNKIRLFEQETRSSHVD